jgi:LmbE family N-acetylglucosaminyl deacetylase
MEMAVYDMRKIILGNLLFILLIGFTTQPNVEAAKINKNANSHVIFYVPHQDDEALSFGLGIVNHVKSGHIVHVVLLTDGSASAVRKKIGMTEKNFTEARNKEFRLSLSAMGVKPQNVEYLNYKDSQLTVKNVENIIKIYEKKYPNAKHKSFSWTDSGNHDHQNAGKALKNLEKTKKISDARYYVRRGDQPKGFKLTTEKYNPIFKPIFQKVSKAYSTYDPTKGFYAIGRTSVKKSFIEFDKQPLSRYHK